MTNLSPQQSPGTWIQVAALGPNPRWGHVAVLDAKRHQIVVFGGVGGDTNVWVFSLVSRTWQHINAPNGPASLVSARGVADPENDRMVIACGVADGSIVNQVWSFNFANQSWSQLPTGPSPRFDLDATTDGAHAWFFGGFFPGFVATNELWRFDFATNRWTLVPAGHNAPSPRTNAGLGYYSGFLYLTGGHNSTALTVGTWRYDLKGRSWAQLVPTGTPGAGAHFGYDVDQDCGNLLLAFGDHDDGIDVATTDLLSLSSTPEFSRLPAITVPPPRRHAPLVLDPQTRTLFTFGGLQGSSTLLGDTWIYHLAGCLR